MIQNGPAQWSQKSPWGLDWAGSVLWCGPWDYLLNHSGKRLQSFEFHCVWCVVVCLRIVYISMCMCVFVFLYVCVCFMNFNCFICMLTTHLWHTHTHSRCLLSSLCALLCEAAAINHPADILSVCVRWVLIDDDKWMRKHKDLWHTNVSLCSLFRYTVFLRVFTTVSLIQNGQ